MPNFGKSFIAIVLAILPVLAWSAVPKERFELNSKMRLAELNQRISALKARVNTADKSSETDFSGSVTGLNDERLATEDLIGQLNRKHTAAAQGKIEKQVNFALEKLEDHVDHVEKNFQR